jgi:hypothetical protein
VRMSEVFSSAGMLLLESNSLLLNFISGLVVFDFLYVRRLFPADLVCLGCRNLSRLLPGLTTAFPEQVASSQFIHAIHTTKNDKPYVDWLRTTIVKIFRLHGDPSRRESERWRPPGPPYIRYGARRPSPRRPKHSYYTTNTRAATGTMQWPIPSKPPPDRARGRE